MSSTPAEATLEHVRRLIAFDTTSRDSNLPLIEHAAALLAGVGVDATLVLDETGAKANLFATFPAADGAVDGGIVLSGHTDVVPVDGQAWSSDPFAAEVRDGRLYGRGACDMKSFVGVVLSRLPAIAAMPLAEPLHLALSYDEEVGCFGAADLVQAMTDAGIRPRGCIVGEPTGMRVVRGHKSITVIRVDVRGVAAHSSLTPDGVNAIALAAEFVHFVEEVAAEFRQSGPFDDAYVVPYTTATVNRIDGGIAVNTIPADCTLTFEFRALAAVDLDATIGRFRAQAQRIAAAAAQRHPEAGVELTVLASVPGVDTAADASIVAQAASWGGIPSDGKVTYGTEAGLFDRAGIPTVVCGPGEIAQAHAPDEFIELDQIAACERFIDALVASLRAR
ncbi:acetylornithine deacetylase [Microbacterium sp.]|uniref:acetylornithine deacetylase n=1 Tax=Microbacterium sp. TaxID=51671 RepID=UPI0039E24876